MCASPSSEDVGIREKQEIEQTGIRPLAGFGMDLPSVMRGLEESCLLDSGHLAGTRTPARSSLEIDNTSLRPAILHITHDTASQGDYRYPLESIQLHEKWQVAVERGPMGPSADLFRSNSNGTGHEAGTTGETWMAIVGLAPSTSLLDIGNQQNPRLLVRTDFGKCGDLRGGT